MLEPDGSPNTAHSLNPVPFVVTREGLTLRYTFLPPATPYEHPVVYAANQQVIDRWFDEHGSGFVERARQLHAGT